MPISYNLCSECSNCNNCYHAAGGFYVSLSLFKDIFQFQTTEITNNILNTSVFTDPNADITYHLNAPLYPSINPAHAMMDATMSENAMKTEGVDSCLNVLKYDFIRYIVNDQICGMSYMGLFYSNLDSISQKLIGLHL